jgi:glycosyltransferase involved in cell wall biosynthesis
MTRTRVIRVAHLLPSLEIGGKERTVLDLCHQAASHGQVPIIITYDPVADGRQQFSAGAIRRFSLNRHEPLTFAEQLNSIVKSEKIDILHAHGHVAAIYANLALDHRIRRVCTIHINPQGSWRWIFPIIGALRKMDQLVAVSSDLGRLFQKLTWRNIQIIPTGIDIEKYTNAHGKQEARPFTIGMIARLHSVKRHTDAIEALSFMHKRGSKAELLIAGDGPEMVSLMQQAENGTGIHFIGAIQNIAPVYKKLDCFLLCSDHEAMPVALLEALASGLPCVVTNVGGMQDFVTNKAVIGCPPRQPARLGQALLDLEKSENLRQSLARRGLEFVQDYSLEKQARAYADIYRHLLQ